MIVFNMVREGILSKADTDQLDDFKDSIFFENLFDQNLGYQLENEKNVIFKFINRNKRSS